MSATARARRKNYRAGEAKRWADSSKKVEHYQMAFVYRVNATMTNFVQVDVSSDIELSRDQIESLAKPQIVREFGHCDEDQIDEIEIVSRPTPVRADG